MPTLRMIQKPYRADAHFLPIVEMKIAGRPHLFIVDTGAMITVLTKRLFGLLSEQQLKTMIDYSVGGVGETSAPSYAVKIKCTFIGVTIPFVTFVPSLDRFEESTGMQIGGIIGQDILTQFSSIEFDNAAGVVRFKL